MKILVTGARGFIGKNLVANLKAAGYTDIVEYDVDSDPAELEDICSGCGFIFHLAGVNRPETEDEFMQGNFGFTSALLDAVRKSGTKCPIMLSSSTQAELDNPYGQSKLAGEKLLRGFADETGCEALIYRFTNVFGKWCRPNYNSAVATFCHNIARDLPITVRDRAAVLRLVYIDDITAELIRALEGNPTRNGEFCIVPELYETTLGEVVDLIYGFRNSRSDLSIPNMTGLSAKLYATYLSYLPEDDFSYPLTTHSDERGSFTELLRTGERGQVSVNISKPGITKGNHWHNTKNEKFIVVSGEGVIRFRPVCGGDIIEYRVSGRDMTVVDIPTGYTHSIENTGDSDLVTVMWASECFDHDRPDTIYLPVKE